MTASALTQINIIDTLHYGHILKYIIYDQFYFNLGILTVAKFVFHCLFETRLSQSPLHEPVRCMRSVPDKKHSFLLLLKT